MGESQNYARIEQNLFSKTWGKFLISLHNEKFIWKLKLGNWRIKIATAVFLLALCIILYINLRQHRVDDGRWSRVRAATAGDGFLWLVDLILVGRVAAAAGRLPQVEVDLGIDIPAGRRGGEVWVIGGRLGAAVRAPEFGHALSQQGHLDVRDARTQGKQGELHVDMTHAACLRDHQLKQMFIPARTVRRDSNNDTFIQWSLLINFFARWKWIFQIGLIIQVVSHGGGIFKAVNTVLYWKFYFLFFLNANFGGLSEYLLQILIITSQIYKGGY